MSNHDSWWQQPWPLCRWPASDTGAARRRGGDAKMILKAMSDYVGGLNTIELDL